MRVIGIIAIQDRDVMGDIIDVDGCDVSPLQERHVPIKSDFEELSVKNLVGSILEVKKVLDVTVVHPDNTEELFLQAKVPGKSFIMVVANIDRDKIEPAMLPLYSFGVGGLVLEKYDAVPHLEDLVGTNIPERLDQEETSDGLLLKRTLLRELTVTTKPAHPAYRLHLSCQKCGKPDRAYRCCPCGCVTCECEAPDTFGAYDAIKVRMGL